MMTAIVVEQKEAREAEIQFEIQRTWTGKRGSIRFRTNRIGRP